MPPDSAFTSLPPHTPTRDVSWVSYSPPTPPIVPIYKPYHAAPIHLGGGVHLLDANVSMQHAGWLRVDVLLRGALTPNGSLSGDILWASPRPLVVQGVSLPGVRLISAGGRMVCSAVRDERASASVSATWRDECTVLARHSTPGGSVGLHVSADDAGKLTWAPGLSHGDVLATLHVSLEHDVLGLERSGALRGTARRGRWTQVAAGRDFTCAVRMDGTLWCWGLNSSGQLGQGHTTDVWSPGQVMPATWGSATPSHTRVMQVKAGTHHACALDEAGSLWCWGHNFRSQLGVGNTVDGPLPQRVAPGQWGTGPGRMPIVSFGLGAEHTCAVPTDQSLWCWGRAAWGALGLGFSHPNQQTPARVQAGLWGNATHQLAVVSLAVGGYHTCALLTDSSVWCFGREELSGQIGAPSTMIPVRVRASQWGNATSQTRPVTLAAGGWHTCAGLEDGSHWCWGREHRGQLGVNITNNGLLPAKVKWPALAQPLLMPDSHAAAWPLLVGGLEHTCAILTDTSLWCWGSNSKGQLGLGRIKNTLLPDQLVPHKVSFATASKLGSSPLVDVQVRCIAAGTRHTCAILDDGSLWCWGSPTSGSLGIGMVDWPMQVPAMLLQLPSDVAAATQTTLVTSTQAVHVAEHGLCAIFGDGQAWCWGSALTGQSPSFGTHLLSLFPTSERTGVRHITLSRSSSPFACVVLYNGALWCLGHNGAGQLGVGVASGIEPTPQQVLPDIWAGHDRNSTSTELDCDWVLQVKAGWSHTCAILGDGSLWCWGSGFSGQLGIGALVNQVEPVRVGNTSWGTSAEDATHRIIEVELTSSATLALVSDGSVWAWGRQQEGQLGTGSTADESLPVRLKPHAWGNDTSQVHVAAISAGGYHACALLVNGSAYCWGAGWSGQLGQGDTANHHFPVPIICTEWFIDGNHSAEYDNTMAVVQISAGVEHTCAILEDGTLWCWGDNYYGQLGLEGVDSTYTPQQVNPSVWDARHSAIVRSVSVGHKSTCAILHDGTLWCWGSRGDMLSGELTALPSVVDTSTPIRVPAPPMPANHTPTPPRSLVLAPHTDITLSLQIAGHAAPAGSFTAVSPPCPPPRALLDLAPDAAHHCAALGVNVSQGTNATAADMAAAVHAAAAVLTDAIAATPYWHDTLGQLAATVARTWYADPSLTWPMLQLASRLGAAYAHADSGARLTTGEAAPPLQLLVTAVRRCEAPGAGGASGNGSAVWQVGPLGVTVSRQAHTLVHMTGHEHAGHSSGGALAASGGGQQCRVSGCGKWLVAAAWSESGGGAVGGDRAWEEVGGAGGVRLEANASDLVYLPLGEGAWG